jgi:hypothetical protein
MQRTILKDVQVLAALVLPAWPGINRRIDASGHPTCHTATDDATLKGRLCEIEAALGEAREEHVVLRGAAAASKSAYVKDPSAAPSSAVFRTAQRDAEALQGCEERISSLTQEQVGCLKLVGGGASHRGRSGRNGPRSGDGMAGDGFAFAARELGLGEGGRTHINLPAADLLRPAVPMAGTTFTPEHPGMPGLLVPGITEAPADRRFIYPFLVRGEDLEAGDLSVNEWTQTSRAIAEEGEVERFPADVTPKAELNLGVDLATPSVKQMAAITKAPNQLMESIDTFADFMRSELQYQLDKGLDAHVLAAITAAEVPHGKTGADLIARVRNAKAIMLASGANPTLVALTPTQAAELDLVKTELGYLFGLRPGGATELWGLRVIESPTVTNPTLIDPLVLGRLYLEAGTILLDPFHHADTNESRIRVEFDALYHCRYPVGAYEVK